jgi:D-3-phosphoglycerate dehydrogenase
VKILLTTASFQETPGPHHAELEKSGFEIVRDKGPLSEAKMLEYAKQGFDAFLNGDDQITAKVIDAALPRLRVIAKYGIGLDSIDVKHATAKKVPILNTPGVNHTTVAEHCFGLMISLAKNFWPSLRSTKGGEWKRITGNELFGKTIAVLGVGRVGKEVIKRAAAFDMKSIGYDLYWDEKFASQYNVKRAATVPDVLKDADVVSLHMNLDDTNRGMFNKDLLSKMKKGSYLINTARGGLVVEKDIAEACRRKEDGGLGHLGGYGTDVLDKEPPAKDHPFRDIDNIIVTPHIGSRTFESVERQAMRAVTNLVQFLTGGKDYIQANQL